MPLCEFDAASKSTADSDTFSVLIAHSAAQYIIILNGSQAKRRLAGSVTVTFVRICAKAGKISPNFDLSHRIRQAF